MTVDITIALGLRDHTWIERTVRIELTEAQAWDLEEDTYPAAEMAFDHLLKHEPEYLNKLSLSFWTLLAYSTVMD